MASQPVYGRQFNLGTIHCVAFQPGPGRFLAAVESDSILLWDLHRSEGFAIQPLRDLIAVYWHPDGRRLVCSGRGIIVVWNLDSHSAEQPIPVGATQSLVAWQPGSGEFLASFPFGSAEVGLWDATTGARVRTMKTGSTRDGAMRFRPDGQILAISGQATVQLWDVAKGGVVAELPMPSGPWKAVTAIAWSPDGACLAASYEDRTIRLWDVHTATVRSVLPESAHGTVGLAISPNGQFLVSTDNDFLRIWNLDSGALHHRTEQSRMSTIHSLDWRGSRVATGTLKGQLSMWDSSNWTSPPHSICGALFTKPTPAPRPNPVPSPKNAAASWISPRNPGAARSVSLEEFVKAMLAQGAVEGVMTGCSVRDPEVGGLFEGSCEWQTPDGTVVGRVERWYFWYDSVYFYWLL